MIADLKELIVSKLTKLQDGPEVAAASAPAAAAPDAGAAPGAGGDPEAAPAAASGGGAQGLAAEPALVAGPEAEAGGYSLCMIKGDFLATYNYELDLSALGRVKLRDLILDVFGSDVELRWRLEEEMNTRRAILLGPAPAGAAAAAAAASAVAQAANGSGGGAAEPDAAGDDSALLAALEDGGDGEGEGAPGGDRAPAGAAVKQEPGEQQPGVVERPVRAVEGVGTGAVKSEPPATGEVPGTAGGGGGAAAAAERAGAGAGAMQVDSGVGGGNDYVLEGLLPSKPVAGSTPAAHHPAVRAAAARGGSGGGGAAAAAGTVMDQLAADPGVAASIQEAARGLALDWRQLAAEFESEDAAAARELWQVRRFKHARAICR
ncbi:hypothetical protein MNEG_16230 [Monoraphidium neglectum]|uniref:Uncharacterized protein n=1 Tax=Monoraphidium neglectum TaxID=145388 RepID=A0A0D2LI82_9CHLO|nr:hypothetical protein MNEG_16230 [Monoraphidium neglectum]KIY91734.1 hypothetical protein MNEG_16230 [Monoraphidium neglectum]|eukprot:XP_013890754.1 hypothetical protein MNEG_16230 [Monoraphidium neglectum]